MLGHAGGGLLRLRELELIVTVKAASQLFAVCDDGAHLSRIDGGGRAGCLHDRAVERVRPVERGRRAEHAIAADHARFHNVAVFQRDDERNDAADREIHPADPASRVVKHGFPVQFDRLQKRPENGDVGVGKVAKKFVL